MITQRQPSPVGQIGIAVSAFMVALKVIEVLAGLKDVMELWELAKKHWPLLEAIPTWGGPVMAVATAALLAYAACRYWYRRQLRTIDLPEKWEPPLAHFSGDRRLSFRYATDPQDIAILARTEDYGDHGTSDVALATEWWRAYPKGNRLAIYRGQIIGGIDIWPLTKGAYKHMLNGDISDLDLRPNHFRTQRRNGASYWYAGSVSIGEVWRCSRARQELLLRLLIDSLESWLERKPTFPAHVIALAWTGAGRNLLRRNGFTYYTGTKTGRHREDTYTLTFTARGDVSRFTKNLKSRLRERADASRSELVSASEYAEVSDASRSARPVAPTSATAPSASKPLPTRRTPARDQ